MKNVKLSPTVVVALVACVVLVACQYLHVNLTSVQPLIVPLLAALLGQQLGHVSSNVNGNLTRLTGLLEQFGASLAASVPAASVVAVPAPATPATPAREVQTLVQTPAAAPVAPAPAPVAPAPAPVAPVAVAPVAG